MPGVYGTHAPVSLQPGDVAYVLGTKAIYGFQGSGGSGSPNLSLDQPQALTAGQASGPVVISAMGGRHPSTQRQLIWEVIPTGAVTLALQVAIRDLAGDYVTIDTYSSSSASGPRVIPSDMGTSPGTPEAQSTAKILSASRFIRVIDTGSGSTAIVPVTCL